MGLSDSLKIQNIPGSPPTRIRDDPENEVDFP